MKRCLMVLALLGLWTAPALGQNVFFDDFDGDALLPHWVQPPSYWWEHNVSNGMLNVTDLLYPSSSHPPPNVNYAIMAASFAPQQNFQLDARMGWGTSEGVSRFDLIVMINQGLVATIGYREHDISGPPGIYARVGPSMVTIPSPPPGIYDFRITRVGALFNFYFEGNLFATLSSAYAGPVDGLNFHFSRPYPGITGPFHIDRVQVVPAPGAFVILPLLALAITIRRRH